MGQELSLVIDELHALPSEKRLDGLSCVLDNSERRDTLQKGAKDAGLPIRISKDKPSDRLFSRLRNKSQQWTVESSLVKQWSSNLSSFWKSPAWTAAFHTCQLPQIYANNLQLLDRVGNDRLRLRFTYVFFFDIFNVLFPLQRNTKDAYWAFANLVSPSGGNDIETVCSYTQDWIARGRRYAKLAETFGDWIILELPLDIPLRFETHLPLEDVSYEKQVEVIRSFQLKGPAIEKGSVELGHRLREASIEPFRNILQNTGIGLPKNHDFVPLTDDPIRITLTSPLPVTTLTKRRRLNGDTSTTPSLPSGALPKQCDVGHAAFNTLVEIASSTELSDQKIKQQYARMFEHGSQGLHDQREVLNQDGRRPGLAEIVSGRNLQGYCPQQWSNFSRIGALPNVGIAPNYESNTAPSVLDDQVQVSGSLVPWNGTGMAYVVGGEGNAVGVPAESLLDNLDSPDPFFNLQ